MDLESARSAGEELIVISEKSTITSLHDGEGKKVVSEPALMAGVKWCRRGQRPDYEV